MTALVHQDPDTTCEAPPVELGEFHMAPDETATCGYCAGVLVQVEAAPKGAT